MSEDEYQRRVCDVERYYTERVYDANWRTRMYYPQALAVMSFICEVIEAEFYQVENPEPPYPWMAKHLVFWQARWSNDGRSQ